ncbi:lipoprotein [Halalkalibacter kiskunsagensis]|uniref:Lipoprotein n=1 Tax=Halalkalibacter kiskunsagensis TaxID=1548599 RepID=A0ABV6KGP4_9BACI
MKKYLAVLFLTFSIFSLAGCGNDQVPEEGEQIEEVEIEEENGQIEEMEIEKQGEIFDREVIDD